MQIRLTYKDATSIRNRAQRHLLDTGTDCRIGAAQRAVRPSDDGAQIRRSAGSAGEPSAMVPWASQTPAVALRALSPRSTRQDNPGLSNSVGGKTIANWWQLRPAHLRGVTARDSLRWVTPQQSMRSGAMVGLLADSRLRSQQGERSWEIRASRPRRICAPRASAICRHQYIHGCRSDAEGTAQAAFRALRRADP